MRRVTRVVGAFVCRGCCSADQGELQIRRSTPSSTPFLTVRLCSSLPSSLPLPPVSSPAPLTDEGELGAGGKGRPTSVKERDSSGPAPMSNLSSVNPAEDFTEQIFETPGYSGEDAFGHSDPLKAVEDALRTGRRVSASDAASGHGTPTSESAVLPTVDSTAGSAANPALDTDVAKEIDPVASNRNRRRNRRKRTADAILGDVLHDALLLRDMGEKPTADFVYKRTRERMYEAEYGRKPPSARENAAKLIPFPPDFRLHRLLPLFEERGDDAVESAPTDSPSYGATRPAAPARVYTKNYMNTYALLPPDPWPERAVTPDNPVWTRREVDADREKTGGRGLKEWEDRMYGPRPGYEVHGEFLDAMDELGHWEVQLIHFLRVVPLSQRRSLPFLHEWYRLLVHRVLRAERRYIRIRDVALANSNASTALFKRTEQLIDNVRSYYAEAHRSLASANYDPLRMKKSALAPLMRMTDKEFAEWQEVQRQRRNALAAELA
ncbi:hypothetical protein GH5_01007 [Leishmania sp. Ghana 2012 LV757]|uniref:hypothetical protein n=1 Tax=Leishmania sp. Ghana 2012 LV757 TaxID=2803181 RepID=UPI001B62F496|nr:hypothetical protein GH5_01007 [Leishmania sp. Ghana 2012 LV757]